MLSCDNEIIQQIQIFPDLVIGTNMPNLFEKPQLLNEKKKKYGSGKEASMIRDEMGDFDPLNSDAMKLLKENFGDSLRTNELKGIINSLRSYLVIKGIELPKLTRNANRSFLLCVKYVNDHYEILKDLIPFVKLCDDNGNNILATE